MSRALVLGGGGPVGIGWEAGLAVGLAERGVDLAKADRVVGTSAGSVVGFSLASGQDLSQAVDLVDAGAAGGGNEAVPDAGAAGEAAGLEQLMEAVARAASDPEAADEARAELGKVALSAATIDESVWLSMFASLAGVEWPAGFACTAVDCETGRLQVWEQSSGVDPVMAVASSCAVPAIFPPVTIAGRRYMDGGVRDMVNADLATGHDAVIVVSCTLLELPPGFSTPILDAVFGATRELIESIRRGGSKVEVVVPGPEMLEASGFGLRLMDFEQADAAYQAGLKQADAEVDRLREVWAAG